MSGTASRSATASSSSATVTCDSPPYAATVGALRQPARPSPATPTSRTATARREGTAASVPYPCDPRRTPAPPGRRASAGDGSGPLQGPGASLRVLGGRGSFDEDGGQQGVQLLQQRDIAQRRP